MVGMWQHLSPSSFLSQRETPQLLPLHTDTYHGNRDCDVSRVRARLVTSTIALLGDKGLVSPSWQQLLGLHVSWEERKGSLLKHRQEKEEKRRKQNRRLERAAPDYKTKWVGVCICGNLLFPEAGCCVTLHF